MARLYAVAEQPALWRVLPLVALKSNGDVLATRNMVGLYGTAGGGGSAALGSGLSERPSRASRYKAAVPTTAQLPGVSARMTAGDAVSCLVSL